MPVRRLARIVCFALTGALLAGCAGPATYQRGQLPDGARADLAILETTDLHANVVGYDYFKARPDPTLGFERTATLIRRARAAFPNSVLLDDGDTIQGTVLADYQAKVAPLPCAHALAIYRAMDALGYDGGTIGNHEFNYGLPFLAQVTATPMNVDGVGSQRCTGPHYPLVLANLDSARDGKPIFQPWTMLTKTVEAYTPDGSKLSVPLTIAIIGFTPPPIMQWDKQNLDGKVTVSGALEAARKYLPQIRAAHPDLTVALLHGGLDAKPYTPSMENPGWHLAGVPGIDVLLLGHEHSEFPGAHYKGLPDSDAIHGFVRGVPAVMGGFFGKDLGLIKLALVRKDGRWAIYRADTHSEVQPICTPAAAPNKPSCVPADPAIAPLVATAQRATVAYVETPIGRSDVRMSSYFADQGDASALAPVNAALADYVRHTLPRTRPDLTDVPVLGAASAFRTGFGGADDYTDVAPGTLTLRSAADLYVYPNTVSAVLLDGAQLKDWLEASAARFNRIDPSQSAPQPLIDTHYAGFNFDQLQGGIGYAIDVSKPLGQRIVDLTFDARPVTPAQRFVVATNNYRASGGGHVPHLDGSTVALSSTEGAREVVADWIKARGTLRRADLPPRAWHFVPLKTRGPVTFVSAAGKQAIARADGLPGIVQLKDHGDGSATYTIDLSRAAKQP